MRLLCLLRRRSLLFQSSPAEVGIVDGQLQPFISILARRSGRCDAAPVNRASAVMLFQSSPA